MLCTLLSSCSKDFEIFGILRLATLNFKIAHF
jgi:hypothetical protein